MIPKFWYKCFQTGDQTRGVRKPLELYENLKENVPYKKIPICVQTFFRKHYCLPFLNSNQWSNYRKYLGNFRNFHYCVGLTCIAIQYFLYSVFHQLTQSIVCQSTFLFSQSTLNISSLKVKLYKTQYLQIEFKGIFRNKEVNFF